MGNWYAVWSNGNKGCFYGTEQECRDRANKVALPGATLVDFFEIPYPANPQIGPLSSCPPFCFQPLKCKGKTSCPRDYACSE